jgi:hypothetical protein
MALPTNYVEKTWWHMLVGPRSKPPTPIDRVRHDRPAEKRRLEELLVDASANTPVAKAV